MNFATLFNALPGACAQGLIWGIMAIGVYITYKILDLADLTVDGTMCTGGAVCIIFMLNGHSVGVSLFGVYRGNDRGFGDRNLSHGDGYPGDPRGNPDSAWSLLYQPSHYGW